MSMKGKVKFYILFYTWQPIVYYVQKGVIFLYHCEHIASIKHLSGVHFIYLKTYATSPTITYIYEHIAACE